MSRAISLAVLLLAVALIACGESADGSAGSGGAVAMPKLRCAHLAPDIPMPEGSAIDILLDGEPVIEDLRFGEAADFLPFAEGDYSFGFAAAGSTQAIFTVPLELVDGDVLTIVAYRVSEADPQLDAFVLDGRIDALDPERGRVHMAHGADDPLLQVVDVIIDAEGACPPALISRFDFGEDVTLVPDPVATTLPLAFALVGDCTPALPALSAPVAPGVVTLLIAVDRDTSANLDPAVYALVGEESGDIPDLDPLP